MGAHVAGKWGKIVGWGTTLLMAGVAIAVIAQIL